MVSARIKLISRNYRPILFEIFYPSLLIVLGALIMTLSLGGSSYANDISIHDLPPNQQFMYSEHPAGVDPSDSMSVVNTFFKNDVFNPVHFEVEGDSFSSRYTNFQQHTFENKRQGETYGSAYFDKIDITETKHDYNVVSVLDITSQSVLAYFTEFISTALLRHSTGDSDLSINLSYGSFPRSKIVDHMLTTTIAIMTVISFSLAVGSITSAIAANIVMERNDTVKHQQIISGASILAYWISIYIVDILKFMIPAISFVVVTYVMNFEVEYAWLLLILVILSVLPFTYCLTFLFDKDTAARTTMNYIQSFVGGFMSLIIFAFHMLQSGGVYIQIIKWVCRLQPGFAF